MIQDKLEPRPFCGGEGFSGCDDTAYNVICDDCDALGPGSDNEHESIRLWNTRVAKVGVWECRKMGDFVGVESDIGAKEDG